jgi:hypothetical protein
MTSESLLWDVVGMIQDKMAQLEREVRELQALSIPADEVVAGDTSSEERVKHEHCQAYRPEDCVVGQPDSLCPDCDLNDAVVES